MSMTNVCISQKGLPASVRFYNSPEKVLKNDSVQNLAALPENCTGPQTVNFRQKAQSSRRALVHLHQFLQLSPYQSSVKIKSDILSSQVQRLYLFEPHCWMLECTWLSDNGPSPAKQCFWMIFSKLGPTLSTNHSNSFNQLHSIGEYACSIVWWSVVNHLLKPKDYQNGRYKDGSQEC